MSANIYGAGLTSPSKQTILPVMLTSGRVVAFLPITVTTFAGTETTYTTANGPVPITSVQLPPKNVTNVYDEQRVEEFMVIQWPETDDSSSPWLGYPGMVLPDMPNTIGYYSWWSMPVTTIFQHFGRGVYLSALKFNMDQTVPAGTSPTPPPVTNGDLRWACTMDQQAFETSCAFIDFNWVQLFQAQLQTDGVTNNVIPLSITTDSNPTGGQFKASVLQGLGGQTVYPGGGVMFDTIRIIRLQAPAAGNYTFTFTITANDNGVVETSNATLTLTVV
jgi:hypothetical protein